MIRYDEIINIINNSTNNIIEFINKYAWFCCRNGYSYISKSDISVDCALNDTDPKHDCPCKYFTYYEYHLIRGDIISRDGSYDEYYVVFVKHNYSYILNIGIKI